MVPWKQVYDAVKQVVTLSQETQKNKSDIKQVREEVDALTEEVKGMRQQLQDLTRGSPCGLPLLFGDAVG